MKAFVSLLIRFFAALLVFCLFLSLLSFGVYAEPSLASAVSVYVYNLNTGTVIMSSAADAEVYPASTVKIMTSLLAVELLSDRLGESVTITSEMLLDASGYMFGFKAGQSVTIRDLVYACACGSYNDAATALAVIACGSTAEFVKKMNERAKALGALSTVYVNVTGLDEDGAVTTARDVAKIAGAAAQSSIVINPESGAVLLGVSSAYSYNFRFGDGSGGSFVNRNALHDYNNTEAYNSNAYGLTSGETEFGGCCTVTCGRYGENKSVKYICVVMGTDSEHRYSLVNEILKWTDENNSYSILREKGSVCGTASAELTGSDNEIELILADDIGILNASDDREFTESLRLLKERPAPPLSAGDIVGYYTVWDGDVMIGCVQVTVAEDVNANRFLSLLDSLKSYFTGRAFVATLVCAAILGLSAFFISRLPKDKLTRHRYGRKRRRYKYVGK